jgi:hypothetical protein
MECPWLFHALAAEFETSSLPAARKKSRVFPRKALFGVASELAIPLTERSVRRSHSGFGPLQQTSAIMRVDTRPRIACRRAAWLTPQLKRDPAHHQHFAD